MGDYPAKETGVFPTPKQEGEPGITGTRQQDGHNRIAALVTDGDGTEMYATTLLRCQCCGAVVAGPQLRDHEIGDVVRLVTAHDIPYNSMLVRVERGQDAEIIGYDHEQGQYTVEAGGIVAGGSEFAGQSRLVRFGVYPNETRTLPVRRKNERRGR